MKKPPRNSQTAGGDFFSLKGKEMTPKPPPRHGNQQGTVSAKTSRLLQLYEDELAVRYTERTPPSYLPHVHAFLGWLSARGIELGAARTEDLAAYQSELFALRKKDGRPYAASYQSMRLSVLKSFFRFLARRGFLLHDPSAEIEHPKLDSRLPRTILTKEEARRILEAPDIKTPQGLRDRAILETFYATGIRVSELASLTPCDVDTEERTLRVVLGKGRKDRNVPLTRAAADAIEAYLMKGRPQLVGPRRVRFLFLQDRGGKMDRSTLARIVSHWAKAARVKKHVTPHTFRHSVATHLLKGRADIRHIQALLGHSSLRTTERYTRVEISDLREVIRRAHPRGR